MSFISYTFVALFLVVYAGRLLIGRRKTETPYVALLLLASCAFYAWHVPAYLLVMLTSTVIDYFAALWMVRLPERSARRRLLLAASLVANLGMLGFFKYAGFATESIGRVLGLLGLGLPVGTLDVVLPIGISFYTFQSMSYTIDVYRGQLRPTRDFTRFLLYVCFFPQLVAGPIVRARDFLYQFARRRQLSLQTFNAGLYLIVRGYFLKVVCANNIAVCVDRYWDAGWQGALNSPALLLLAILFSFQIFCDFEGYSSIARGLANLLGFRLPLNFNNPYLATSFKNFWQRWHITLSQWLRDYLYLPLGGNRGGRWRTLTNLMIVMLLGGLWHGAAFHFVAWGGIHGAALVVERLLGLERAGAGRPRALRIAWAVVVQFGVLAAWIFFRSPWVSAGTAFIRGILACDLAAPPTEILWAGLFLLPPVLMHLRGLATERGWLPKSGRVEQAVAAGVMGAALITCYGPDSAFIYFQF